MTSGKKGRRSQTLHQHEGYEGYGRHREKRKNEESGNGSRGKISTTNWNINELPPGQNPVPGFVSGGFNSVNLKSGNYKITGQKINETHFCQPPVSVPITISGSCNQNVVINVRFESNDPILTTGGSFTGDVTCSQNTINK